MIPRSSKIEAKWAVIELRLVAFSMKKFEDRNQTGQRTYIILVDSVL